MAQDYANNILEAIEVLAQKKVNEAGYDKTIKAIVTSTDQATEGIYTCQYEAITFTAFGLKNTFEVDDVVMVNIPQNDWDNPKTILNKLYIKADERASTDILKDFLRFDDDPSTFMSFAEEQKGLIANVHKPFSPDVGPRSDDVILLEETSLASYYLEPYSKLYITAKFNTGKLVPFKVNNGTFGIRVIFRDKNHNIISQYELNTMNMIGNLYNFQEWVEQRCLVTLDPEKIDSNGFIEILGFQSGDFTMYTQKNATVILVYPDEYIPEDNILIKEGKIQFGYSNNEFKEGDINLLSESSKQYYRSWDDSDNLKQFTWRYWYKEGDKLSRTNQVDLSLLTIERQIGTEDWEEIFKEGVINLPNLSVTTEGFKDNLSNTDAVTAEEIGYRIKIKHDNFDTDSSVRYTHFESNEIWFYRYNPGVGGKEYDELHALSLSYEYEDETSGVITYNEFENQLLTQEEAFKPHYIHAIFNPTSEELKEEHWLGGATLIWEVPGLLRANPDQQITATDLDNIFNKEKLFFIQSPKTNREYNSSVMTIEQIVNDDIPYVRYTIVLQEGIVYDNDLERRKGDNDTIISNDIRALSLRFLPKYQYLPSMVKSLIIKCVIKKENLTLAEEIEISADVDSKNQSKAANNRFTIITERMDYPFVKKGENNVLYFRSYNHGYDNTEVNINKQPTTILRPTKTMQVPPEVKAAFTTTENNLMVRKSIKSIHRFINGDPGSDGYESFEQHTETLGNEVVNYSDWYSTVLVYKTSDNYHQKDRVSVDRLFRWYKYVSVFFVPVSEFFYDFEKFINTIYNTNIEDTLNISVDGIAYQAFIGYGEYYNHRGAPIDYSRPNLYGEEFNEEYDDGTVDSSFTYTGEYELTTDTSIVPGKTYYIQINTFTYEEVQNPIPSELNTYYEFVVKEYEKGFTWNTFHRVFSLSLPADTEYELTMADFERDLITLLREDFQANATIETPTITPIFNNTDNHINYGNGIDWDRLPTEPGGSMPSQWYKLTVPAAASIGALPFLALQNKNRGICNILEIPTSFNNELMRGNNKIYVGPAEANGNIGPSEINLKVYKLSNNTGFFKEFVTDEEDHEGYVLTNYLSARKYFNPKIVTQETDRETGYPDHIKYYNYLIQQDPLGFSTEFKEYGTDKPSVTVVNYKQSGVYLPIVFQQVNKFTDEFLEWDGRSVKIGNTGVYGPVIGGGSRNGSGEFTGCLMGKIQAADLQEINHGLFGQKNDVQVFGLRDNGTMFIGKNGSGQLMFDGNKSTIQSNSYATSPTNNKTGMLLDFDDGLIDIRNSKNDTKYFMTLDVRSSNLSDNDKPLKIGTGNDPKFSVKWDGTVHAKDIVINSGTLSGVLKTVEGGTTTIEKVTIKSSKVINNNGKGLNFDSDGNLLLDAGIELGAGGIITSANDNSSYIGIETGHILLHSVYSDGLTMYSGGIINLNGGQSATGSGTLSASGLNFNGISGINLVNGSISISGSGTITVGGYTGNWKTVHIYPQISTKTVEVSLAGGGTEEIIVFKSSPIGHDYYYFGHT